MEVDKIKSTIEKLEKGLNNPVITENLKSGMRTQLEKLKVQLSEAEAKAQKEAQEAQEKIKEEEKKIAEAKKEGDKEAEKKAKAKLEEAKEEKKEAVAEVKEAEKVEKHIKKVEKKASHGGAGRGQGRKPDPNKVVKPKGKRGGFRAGAGAKKKIFIKRPIVPVKKKGSKLMKPKALALLNKSKEKTVKVFGQSVVFKSDAEFCSKLIQAFKKRRSVYKATKKRTKPVFGVITSKVADAVNKAMHSVTAKQIHDNPKKIMGYLKNSEKKAKEFLESLKPLMGSSYKHSEIAKEFGDIEQAIKKAFAKHVK